MKEPDYEPDEFDLMQHAWRDNDDDPPSTKPGRKVDCWFLWTRNLLILEWTYSLWPLVHFVPLLACCAVCARPSFIAMWWISWTHRNTPKSWDTYQFLLMSLFTQACPCLGLYACPSNRISKPATRKQISLESWVVCLLRTGGHSWWHL